MSNGLHEIVVGTEHEAGRAIQRSRPIGGDENDRKFGAKSLVELAKDLETAQCAGKLDLDDRERWTVAVESFEKKLGVFDGPHFIPQADSDTHRQQTGDVVVVDDEDRVAVSHAPRELSR